MKLAIKGHPERGKEVLNILKSLGGKERASTQWSYSYKENLYYINKDGEIDYGFGQNTLYKTTHKIYTLEEFEELYPYKVGDKVLTRRKFNINIPAVVERMYWRNNEIIYLIKDSFNKSHEVSVTHLMPYNMKQKKLKDYLKPGYVVEYDDGSRFVITQDVHGNNFGLQLGASIMWADFIHLDGIVKVYQINKPGALHKTFTYDTHLTLVWEKPKEEVELTMQQIADKFGIDVNQLKIKK